VAEPAAALGSRMIKALLVAAAVLVVLGVGALAAVPWLVDTPRVQAYLSGAVAQSIGRSVRFSSLAVSVFPTPAVRLRGLQIAEDPRFGPGAFLTVNDGRIRIRLAPLFTGRLELADVTLDGLTVAVVEDAGQWNVASLGAITAPGRASAGRGTSAGAVSTVGGLGAALSRMRIVDGAIEYRKRGVDGPGVRLERVALTIAPGPRPDILTVRGEALTRPGAARLRLTEATLSIVPGRPLGDALVKAAIDLKVDDVGSLGVVTAPRVAGALTGTVNVGGSLAKVSGTGELRAERLTLAPEAARCGAAARRPLVVDEVRVPLALAPGRVDSRPVRASSSGGTMTFELHALTGSSPIVAIRNLRIAGMELRPILVDYLCQPYAVSGPLELTGDAAFAPGDPWRTLEGVGRLRVGRGQVLGEGVLQVLSQAVRLGTTLVSPLSVPEVWRWTREDPLDFDAISATYRVAAGVATTRDLLYESRRFRGTGVGTYGLGDGRIDMAVTLSQGQGEVRARVAGPPGAVTVVPTGITGPPGEARRLVERLAR
jgi:AsmA protein